MTLILETCVLYIKDHYQASNISINAPVSTPEGGRGGEPVIQQPPTKSSQRCTNSSTCEDFIVNFCSITLQ